MGMEYFDIYWIHNPVGAPEYTKQLIPLLQNGIVFYGYMTLEQGALSGKYDTEHPFPDDSARVDDNHTIQDALLASDMVVFVMPIYYFGMSAQLKMVIDRFYSYTTRLSGKHLKAVLITAAWDSDKDVMPYTAEHYKKLCRYMNFENVGMVLGTGCGSPSMTKGTKHMKDAYDLGRTI